MKAGTKTLPKRIASDQVERIIFQMRGQRVILDSDLAKLYKVPTMALNQAVKRNVDRFPADFAFQLTNQEFASLISQTVISNAGSGSGRGGRQKLPMVFTEHGVAMLSSVLRSKTAVKVNIEIVRTFVRLRHFFATPGEIISELTKLREKAELHDHQILAISEILEQLTAPPDQPKRKIGFL